MLAVRYLIVPSWKPLNNPAWLPFCPKPFDAMQLGKALNAAVDLLSPAELELTLFDVHDVRVLVVDDSRLSQKPLSSRCTGC